VPGQRRELLSSADRALASKVLFTRVYQVVQGTAILRDIVRGPDVPRATSIGDPAEGEWRVVLDAYAVPGRDEQ
jgi:hypothetical protein